MRLTLSALLAVALLAGCVQPAATVVTDTQSGRPTENLGAVQSIGNTTVAVALPAEFGEGLSTIWANTGFDGAEPNIGITAAGNVFATAFQNVIVSRDQGKTWMIVPNAVQAPTTLDPMLRVDPVSNRIFSEQLYVGCNYLSFSDDEGATWLSNPASCGLPVIDHQKVASGPFAGAFAALNGNPAGTRHVSFCYNKIGGTFCAASFDGGVTYQYDTLVDLSPIGSSIATDRGCGGINGHQKYGPDGTLYVPYGLNCGVGYVGVSTDSGLTFTVRNLKVPQREIDPAITVTPDGTAYYMYRSDDERMYLLRSHDRFATTEGPFLITPGNVNGTVFAGLTSGSDGRIAFAYLGHKGIPDPATQMEPSDAADDTQWHLFVGMSLDAESANPTFVFNQVTPDSDPVQVGCVWLGGGGNPCRNMLDFIDMHTGPDGRWWVAYSDGCASEKCRSGAGTAKVSTDSNLSIASTGFGPSLFADKPAIRAT